MSQINLKSSLLLLNPEYQGFEDKKPSFLSRAGKQLEAAFARFNPFSSSSEPEPQPSSERMREVSRVEVDPNTRMIKTTLIEVPLADDLTIARMSSRVHDLQGRFDALGRIRDVKSTNYEMHANNILSKLSVVKTQIDDLEKEGKTVPFELLNDIRYLESAIKSRIEAKQ